MFKVIAIPDFSNEEGTMNVLIQSKLTKDKANDLVNKCNKLNQPYYFLAVPHNSKFSIN